jgi:NADH-quinone oxidoreductase subunit F
MTITRAPRIVSSRLGKPRSWTLQSYLADGGYRGLRAALAMTPKDVHNHVNTANILGRGGAGFEAGRKWRMLRKAEPVYLTINGDESEPATFHDHALIEGDPHQLIEGAMICAYAIQADQVFLYVRGEFALAIERLQAALNEAYSYGAVGRNVFDSSFSIDIVVHPGAGAYICGEETALLESLEGKRGYPRIKPPFFPAAMGLYGAPTIVNNVETVSNLPWVMLNGGDAFAALGEGRSKGTKTMALSGQVRRPGNYELEWAKVSFRDLIYHPRLGAGIRDDNELKAFIPGGASSPWLGPEHGYGREGDLELLLDVCDNISPGLTWPPAQTTICVLGPSMPPPIVSGLRMFRDEYLAHIREGRCPFPADRLPRSRGRA